MQKYCPTRDGFYFFKTALWKVTNGLACRERSMALFGIIRRLMNNINSENGFLWRLQKIIIVFNQHQ